MIRRLAIHDDAGEPTGATFAIEPRGAALTLRYDSRGTTAGTRAYRAGLVLILTRLGEHGVVISDALVDSTTVKELTRAQKRLRIPQAYPLVPADHDAEQLRKSFHTAAAKVGRPEGARGGGNGTKKLRLYLTTKLNADKLEAALAGEEQA